jgi:hypothetical protein
MKRPLAFAVMGATAIYAPASLLIPSDRAERSPKPIPLANAASGATAISRRNFSCHARERGHPVQL